LAIFGPKPSPSVVRRPSSRKALFGPERLEQAWIEVSAGNWADQAAGTEPFTVVPSRGVLSIASSPPIACRRSAMPCRPVP